MSKNSHEIQNNREEIEVSSLLSFTDFGVSPIEDMGDAVYQSGIAKGEQANTYGQEVYTILEAQGYKSTDFLRYNGSNGYVCIELKNGEIVIFEKDIKTGKITISEKTHENVLLVSKEQEKQKIEFLSKTQRKLEMVMNAIEVVFQKNSQEWFGYIDENDVYEINPSKSPWSEIPEAQGKVHLTLPELQQIAKILFGDIRTQRGEIETPSIEKIDEKLGKLEEKYIDYIVGIGNTYEGGARAFHSTKDKKENVSQEEIETSITRLVAGKSVTECFSYMLRKQSAIEANNRQSTEVTRTYELWNKALNRAVLEKMKTEKSADKVFLQYAKLVSGRNVPELVSQVQGEFRNGEKISSHSLDDKMLDPESASEALLYVFGREGGVFSKIENKIEIKDPKIPEVTSCKSIVENCLTLVDTKINGTEENSARGIFGNAGFQDVLDLDEATTYSSLSLDKKMKLSILVRLSEKLASKTENIPLEDFGKLFLEIAEEGQQTVINGINDDLDGGFLGFGSKDSTDVGLGGLDAEIFDLYNDIWGNGGVFDPSDFSIEYMKLGAVIGASIIATFAVTLTIGALAPFAVASLTSTIITASIVGTGISRMVVPESFDTPKDLAVDLVTDIGTAVFFGFIGGKLTEKTFSSLQDVGMKRLTSFAGWKHIGAIGIDVGLLSIGTEILRNFILRNEHLIIPGTSIDVGIGNDSIEAKNRFSYEDFHNYVSLHLEEFLPKPGLSS